MSKPTPGPWVATGTGAIDAAIPVVQRLPKRAGHGQQTRMSVATICNAAEPHMRAGEAEANASLIAASPDLAAALMALVEQVESGAFDHIAANHPDSAVIAARAALRKAGL